MISFAYKISHCLSVNHNPELRCVICTGVTLFALLLHLTANQNRVIFSCVLSTVKIAKTEKQLVTKRVKNHTHPGHTYLYSPCIGIREYPTGSLGMKITSC